MRILHVISSMNPRAGGPCQGIRNLAPRVLERNHDVEVVCLDDPNSCCLANESLSIHGLGQRSGAWSYSPALRPWLNENLQRFDAIILNGLWQYPGFVLSKLAGGPAAPPYYVFPHGMLDPWFQSAPERRLKAARNWLYWKLIEHKVVQRAEALLFTCTEEMRLAQTTFQPYQPKNQIDVGYGVSEPPPRTQATQAAFQEKCPVLKGRPYLLFLGRIHPKKGVDTLIKAFASVYGSRTGSRNPATCLVIAGPGMETSFGREMFELAARTCPAGSVLWPGMLTGDAKWGALYGAEAFALFSHQENFGIAVVEALSCATPVLISNQVNIWREIEKDKCGLVGDDSLPSAQLTLRQWESLAPSERASMKQAARFSYQSRFGIGQAALNLLNVLQETAIHTRLGILS